MGAGFHTEMANVKPVEGVLLRPRRLDYQHDFAGDPDPVRLQSILRTAAFGDPEAQFELYDKMEEADGHVACESGKRRMAVTGLRWEIESAAIELKNDLSDAETETADEIAKHVRRVVRRIRGLRQGLNHLNGGVQRGIAVCEIEWDRTPDGLVPVALHPVPGFRLRYDYEDPWRLRIMMDEHDHVGIAIDDLPLGKFVVHAPRMIGGSPIRGGLFRPTCFWWMTKVYGVRFFLDALELFGQPFRTATYSPNASAQVQQAMLDMLEYMARSAAGIFPEGSNFQVHESALTAAAKWPQERLVAMANAEISKIQIGATLMTEVSDTGGNRALGEVQNDIREDIRDDDIEAESETITQQIIRPMVALSKFAKNADSDLLPRFKRSVPEPQDDKADAELLDRGINRWGMQVPKRYAVERFKIPVVEGENLDEALPGAPSAADPFSRDMSGDLTLANAERAEQSKRKLDEILKRNSSAAKYSAWLFAVVLAATGHTANVVAAVSGFIEKRRDLETALAELPGVLEELPTEEMQQLHERFLVATKLAGVLDGREKVRKAQSRGATIANTERLALPPSLVANAEIDLQRIPFVRAIESLRDRVGLNPHEFAALETEARSRAWRVAGVYDMSLLATIHTALVQSIANGETSREFRLRLPSMVNAAGWSGENPYHADLVHFQNFMMAHSAGRYSEYQEFGAAGWMFVSNGDACPLCEPFLNKVFRLTDRKAFPPVHFWCDCEDEPVFEGEHDVFDESANIESSALDAARAKVSGFKWDPAEYAALTPIKLGGFPEAMQPAFRKVAESRGWEIAA